MDNRIKSPIISSSNQNNQENIVIDENAKAIGRTLQIVRAHNAGDLILSDDDKEQARRLAGILSDAEVIEKICAQPKHALVWRGDWSLAGYDTPAGAEMALLNRLAFFTQKDTPRIYRLYRQSGLYANVRQYEFNEYSEMFILNAIERCKGEYNPIDDTKTITIPLKSHDDIITEMRLADAIKRDYQKLYRYCVISGQWLKLDNNWRKDILRTIETIIQTRCKEAIAAIGDEKKACRVERWATAAGVKQSLQHDSEMLRETWDEDDFLLGTPGQTVDLLTGELRAARYDDYITKQTLVEPKKGTPEKWLRFLEDCTGNDEEMIRYLQKICGYCLTGSTKEHALFFVHGDAGTGKTTFLETISNIMGDYATVAAMETFIHSNSDKHPTDLASLAGARLVTASETDEGRSWAESKLKQITGGDKIAARYMRQDFFQYQPKFKIIIIGNYAPVLRNVDDAMKRRLHLVPFRRKPRAIDTELKNKLRAEYPLILNWMIEGTALYREKGLAKPVQVVNATDDYFSEQDSIGDWLQNCCIISPTASATPTALAQSYSEYSGEKISVKRMTIIMNRLSSNLMITRQRKLDSLTNRSKNLWKGIGIISSNCDNSYSNDV